MERITPTHEVSDEQEIPEEAPQSAGGRRRYAPGFRRGDRWERAACPSGHNGIAESFFHSFKIEVIQGEVLASRTAMGETVFEYIEVYYNRQRQRRLATWARSSLKQGK